jgi:hypothetical protein
MTQLELVSPGWTLPTITTTRGPEPNVRTGIGKPERDLVNIESAFVKRFLEFRKFVK